MYSPSRLGSVVSTQCYKLIIGESECHQSLVSHWHFLASGCVIEPKKLICFLSALCLQETFYHAIRTIADGYRFKNPSHKTTILETKTSFRLRPTDRVTMSDRKYLINQKNCPVMLLCVVCCRLSIVIGICRPKRACLVRRLCAACHFQSSFFCFLFFCANLDSEFD